MWLTHDLPGTGGSFVSSPEDFHVEEIPLYEAMGEGEHLYLTVKKTGLTTRDLIRRATKVLGVQEADVGYAGLKDKAATAIQTISVRGIAEPDAQRFEGAGVEVLSTRFHRNKLRVGHLAGNRFRAVIRGVDQGAGARARSILDTLVSAGMPNFFGEQRFGVERANVERGLQVLQRGPRVAGSRWRAKFLVSALQSEFFNRYLEERMRAGLLERVFTGDVLMTVARGGIFACEEAEVDQERYDRFEISITGPIFGSEMRPATGVPGEWELAVLSGSEVSIADFQRLGRIGLGTRRALRAPVADADVEENGDSLVVTFRLVPGCYATVLLGEIIKPSASDEPGTAPDREGFPSDAGDVGVAKSDD